MTGKHSPTILLGAHLVSLVLHTLSVLEHGPGLLMAIAWAESLACLYSEDSAGTSGCRASENVGSSVVGLLKGACCLGRPSGW